MPKATAIITNFTAGELSPLLDVRVDTDKYRNGAHQLRNALVMPHGGAKKRPGTKHIFPVRSSDFKSLLVPFQFNTQQSYVVEIASGFMRFYMDQGIITQAPKIITGVTNANPAVVTAASHGFSNGDTVYISPPVGMPELANRSYVVANATTNTFELSGFSTVGFGTYVSGGSVAKLVELAHPYADADIDGLSFAQSADTLFIAHHNYPIKKLTRTSHTNWSIADANIVNGPFKDINTTSTSIAVTGGTTDSFGCKTGSVTLTASAALFNANMVGALVRLWEPGQGTGVANPVAEKDIANFDMYTNAGNVYGLFNLTGTAKWQSDWARPTHTKGVVRIADITGLQYHDSSYLHDTSAVVKITAYTSSTVVTATVVKNKVPASVVSFGTSFFELGAWSPDEGYPGVITFHESRFWAANSPGKPQTIWASKIGEFEDFQDGADDDRAITYEIASDKVDAILWMNAGRTLMFGTASAEYAAASSSQNEALTPSNVRIVRQTPFGSGPLQPLRVSNAILFGQRDGDPANAPKKLRELQYSFDVDSFVAPDLTIVSEHITGAGITEMAYQAAPDAIAWCARSDGKLATLTYEKEQNVAGWALSELGGTSVQVERATVIPGADGDEVWFVVKRTINGSDKRYIEVLTPGLRDNTEPEDAIYLDSAFTYEGASTSVISGLWRLAGDTVNALVDGSKQGPFVVSANGQVTLSAPSNGGPVHIGYSYLTVIETVDLDAAAAAGTAKSRAKKISECWPSLYRSLGGRAGPNASRMFDILYRDSNSVFGSSPALKSDFVRQPMPGGYNRRAYVRFEHDEPYPFTVLGVAVPMSTSG